MNYFVLGILALGGTILTLGDLIMKKWVVSNNWYVFALGLCVWLLGNTCLALSFKFKNIAVASVLLIVFNVLTLTLFSWFYFKEKLSGMEISGMVLGLIAIILLESAE